MYYLYDIVDDTCSSAPPSTDAHYNPGPGAYCPEKVHVNKRSAPTFSLGIRHSEFMTPLIVEVPGE